MRIPNWSNLDKFGTSNFLTHSCIRNSCDGVGCEQDKKTVIVQSHYFTTANKHLVTCLENEKSLPQSAFGA